MKPTDIMPQKMIDELLRLYKLDPHWARWQRLDGESPHYNYKCKPVYNTWLTQIVTKGQASRNGEPVDVGGSEWLAMKAGSWWLGGGPKVFKPTKLQLEALKQIEVNILLEDYAQPYPALLVQINEGPFYAVICYFCETERVLVCSIMSKGHIHDITTTIATTKNFIEESLVVYDDDCLDVCAHAHRACRIAINACLALAHYGNHLQYLFPKEVQRDRHYAQEQSERGQRARDRLHLAVQIASFDQEVKIHREAKRGEPGEPTGHEMPPHWRRGHWAMQPYGPSSSLRKRILRKPVMVRSDLFVGDQSQTVTTYK